MILLLIVTADATTENFETFNLALDNGEDSITVTINDTSLDPTYAVSASRASVNEGESFTVNLTTTDVQDGSWFSIHNHRCVECRY